MDASRENILELINLINLLEETSARINKLTSNIEHEITEDDILLLLADIFKKSHHRLNVYRYNKYS